MKMYDVFLGLGSNVGERQRFLQAAVTALRDQPGVKLVWASPVYETEPYGKRDQPSFLNAALQLETELGPEDLFRTLKAIEAGIGRSRSERWGPREIDIDILIYDGLVHQSDVLTVPHPDMEQRKFVLVPLNDIAPDLIHPVSGLTVSELEGGCRAGGRVVRSVHLLKC